tara:strand:+ start:450 stop:665 length:216 start_codon:yes stop_codon:yes gene_type:complete
MINGIRIQKRGGDFGLIDIPLNSKEMQLAMDKSNASWSLMCDSVNHRLGISIIGNYNLVNIFVNGECRPLH